MNSITYPLCLADLEAVENKLYFQVKQTKDKTLIAELNRKIEKITEKIQSFYASLPTA
jgi:hypothetical protein